MTSEIEYNTRNDIWYEYTGDIISNLSTPKYVRRFNVETKKSDTLQLYLKSKIVYTNPLNDGVNIITFTTSDDYTVPLYTQDSLNQDINSIYWGSTYPILDQNRVGYIPGIGLSFKVPEFVLEVCTYIVVLYAFRM